MDSNFYSLQDKVIIVTGATGVLGNSFIEALGKAGAIVIVLGRNAAVAHERSARLQQRGYKAMALVADVTDQEQLVEARNRIIHEYGHIHGLVNAAGGNMPGAVLQPGADIFNLDMAALQQVMNLNLMGTILPTQIFGEAIQQAGGGSIVNISSMSAQQAITRVLGYSMAKAAVDCYTKWFATELANRFGDTMRMNAIAPGFFITEQNRSLLTNADGSFTTRGQQVISKTPFKRFGEPNELEGVLIWLLSDASRFVTGTVINIDGGFSAYSGV